MNYHFLFIKIMITTILLLIVAYSILGKPIGKLVEKIKDVNWKDLADSAWTSIKTFGLKAGRTTCEPLLTFYYVMSCDETSIADKALVYGAILYIISPFDLIPRRALSLLGVLDDASVAALVIKKIQAKITPEIEAAVEATLDEWFGAAPATC